MEPQANNKPLNQHDQVYLLQQIENLTGQNAQLLAAQKIQNERWQLALQSNGDGLWDWNVVTNEVYFSHEWKAMLGFEDDEILGSLNEWDARIHPEDKQRVYAEIEQYIKGETDRYRSEHRVMCKDGSFKWILDRGQIVERNPDGSPLRMVGTHTDISSSKNALNEVSENLEFFSGMFKNSVVAMLIIDPETGAIADSNAAAQRFYGYTADEFRHLNIAEINQYQQEQITGEMNNAKNHRTNHFIFPHKLKNGESRIVEVYSTPVKRKNKSFLFSQITDITGRIQAESSLRENEEKYRGFIANSSDGFLLTNEDGQIIEWNAAQERITGFLAEEVIGRNAAEMQMNLGPVIKRTPEHYAKIRSLFQNFFVSGTGNFLNNVIILPIVTKYGEERIIEQMCFRIKSSKGFCLGAVTRDVTAEKEKESVLLDNEELFRTMFESAPLGVAQIDSNGRFVRTNSTLSLLLGYTKSELEEFTLYNVTDPVDMGHINTLLQRMIAGVNAGAVFESRCIHKNGTILWVVISCTVLSRQDGIPFFITYINDITARKRAELAVLENEEKLQKIFEILPVGITITDRSGNIIDGNKESERLLGLRKSQQFKRNAADEDWDIVRPDLTPMPANEFASVRALKENTTIMNIKMGLKKNEGITWINVCATPLPMANYGVIITYNDISEQVNSEKELSSLNRQLHESHIQLEEANKAKDKFISIIAHDLRAPFSAFLGISEILAAETESFSYEEISDMSKKMYISSVNTLQLLTDLLDWGRLYTRTMKFNLTEVNIDEIISRAADVLQAVAKEKGLTIVTHYLQTPAVFTDKNLLSNVIRNLISNAIKFSYRGNEIIVRVSSAGDTFSVAVEDKGVGMEPGEVEKLFKVDTINSSPGTEKEKGSGLGLLLCNEFVEKLGGKLTVESEKNRGTTFTITLPVNAVIQ